MTRRPENLKDMKTKRLLVTGAAGFIGFHLSRRFLSAGYSVIGVDNLNDYYDVKLKEARLNILDDSHDFHFIKMDIADNENVSSLFKREAPAIVVHMAAQAGVRYSLVNPHAYQKSNLAGFLNILEGCRKQACQHLVFASSSSVYGANTAMPFSVHHNVDHPISLYAATKKANELMAHAYSSLYKIPCTGLRFFTVYGPWGRPDMALFLFTRAILEDKPIDVYNDGKMQRDFTYIDDIVEGVLRVSCRIPEPDAKWQGDNPDPATSFAPYKIYNIGNNSPVELLDIIKILEKLLGKKARMNLLPMQPGDVPRTFADIDDLMRDVSFKPKTSVEDGIRSFIEWYRKYYNV